MHDRPIAGPAALQHRRGATCPQIVVLVKLVRLRARVAQIALQFSWLKLVDGRHSAGGAGRLRLAGRVQSNACMGQNSAAQHSTAQQHSSTAQHSSAAQQHSTAQHSTAAAPSHLLVQLLSMPHDALTRHAQVLQQQGHIIGQARHRSVAAGVLEQLMLAACLTALREPASQAAHRPASPASASPAC